MAEKPSLGLLIGVGDKPKAGLEAEMPEDEAGDDPQLLAVQAFRKAMTGGSDQEVLDAFNAIFDSLDVDEEPAPDDLGMEAESGVPSF